MVKLYHEQSAYTRYVGPGPVDEPSETDSNDDDIGYGQKLEAGTIKDPEFRDKIERGMRFIFIFSYIIR